ncbi:MAG: chorismate mutase [Lachnospirales bacterium]
MNLDLQRMKINEIDDKLSELLEDRFLISKEIGTIKKEVGMEIFDKNREKEIFKAMEEKYKNSEFSEEIINIFIKIIEESKKVQMRV